MVDATLAGAVDIERLQTAQDSFAKASGLALITVGCTGTPVTEASRFTPFCAMLRSDPGQRSLCQKCDAHGGLQSVVEGTSSLYRCHTGLVDFSVPIMRDGAYLGAILCGQVRVDDSLDLPWVSPLNSSWRRDQDLEQAWQRTRSVTMDRLRERVGDLNELAGDLLRRGIRAARPGSPSLVMQTLRPEPPSPRLSPLPAQALETAVERQDLVTQMRVLEAALDTLFSGGLTRIAPSMLQHLEEAVLRAVDSESEQTSVIVRHRIFRFRALGYSHVGRMQCHNYLEGLLFAHHDAVAAARKTPPSLFDLMNLVERAIANPPSQQRAAQYLNITPSHFAKTFKANTGRTYVSYVTAKRIDRACLLLRHSDMPVSRIASDLRFQPVNYFSRQFKRSMGQTPSEYRAKWVTQEDHEYLSPQN